MPSSFAIAAVICVLLGASPSCFPVQFSNEKPMTFAECTDKIVGYTIGIFTKEEFRRLPLTSFQVWCYPVTMAGMAH